MAKDLRRAAGAPATGPRQSVADLVGALRQTDEAVFGRPVQRWSSRARTVDGIQRELGRIWSAPALAEVIGASGERHVAARTSVLNLVVVAGRPETGVHAAATITQMAGRHPSRSLILTAADPDGPAWLDAQIEAHCVLPAPGVAETCAEMIFVTAGGESGRHLAAIIVPLLIHDLPVLLWWPSDPSFRSHPARELLPMVDRLIVDGSAWAGDGLDRLVEMAHVAGRLGNDIADFGLIRQARWREALASVFDRPELQPYLGSIRAISVDYAAADDADTARRTNVVKPVYHVAWLASRLGMTVAEPLRSVPEGGRRARLRRPGGTVEVSLRPVRSSRPGGTTLRVELVARRRGTTLVGDVTAGDETVDVRILEDGRELLARSFLAPRQREVDLLSQVIEAVGHDAIGAATLRLAAALAKGGPRTTGEPRPAVADAIQPGGAG